MKPEEEIPFAELINGEKPVLVDFYAEWCGPCKMMMPALEQVAEETADRVHVVKIDVDKELELALEYKVMGVPTFIIFKNGEVQWKQAGVLSKFQLLSAIEEYA